MKFVCLILPLIFFSLTSCDPPNQDSKEPMKGNQDGSSEYKKLQEPDLIPFNLNAPSAYYSLPSVLSEISGIYYYGEDLLVCIQDERGTIYLFHTGRGEVVAVQKFSHDGDFEDLTMVDDTLYALRADGMIFRMTGLFRPEETTEKIPMKLTLRNDAEGLAFDRETNSLLIACKGYPYLSRRREVTNLKAIYCFSLQENRLIEQPKFLMDINGRDFQPSGVAVHPITNDIYVLSHAGKLLVLLDRNGKVKGFEQLDPNLFKQPEGICFSPEGELFISNEGNGNTANILKFRYQP